MSAGNPKSLPFVKEGKTFKVDTFKHVWITCSETGNAYSIRKNQGFAQWVIKHLNHKNDYAIYDYFTSQEHVQWSIEESQRFSRDIIEKHEIMIKGKRILDISGGNGIVAKELMKEGAEVVLTEVNDKAIEYAQKVLGIETYKFDFQGDNLSNIVKGKFDIVLLRAALMFCLDLDRFMNDLVKVLNPGAVIVMQYCVIPTLGVYLRTQNDSYSYLALYQPVTIINVSKQRGLSLQFREDEIDRDPYVYDHDINRRLTLLRIWYEYKAVRIIPFTSDFPFRVRERRRSNMIFKYK